MHSIHTLAHSAPPAAHSLASAAASSSSSPSPSLSTPATSESPSPIRLQGLGLYYSERRVMQATAANEDVTDAARVVGDGSLHAHLYCIHIPSHVHYE
ncbi:hypothetical protein C8F01DRAFT_1247919 [Mycena amicta]|nr:hypothetical protein C8F01DRAFT_1266811 [Mycena amicta]KAJ7067558.1 hypothetical protein C8F01DRAFT_1247919 [Mycena amicta]